VQIKLKTLTPLWTGGVDMRCDRLHETSIIGSIRWWYEALVRGLGGWACDPTADSGCPDQRGQRCAACELFGCTGWRRKFNLQVLAPDGDLFVGQIDANKGVKKHTTLILNFVEFSPLGLEEMWLLQHTVQIASDYGAIGGRTPRKPQRNQKIGGDYGLFEIKNVTDKVDIPRDDAIAWLKQDRFRRVSKDTWPDLRWFFFVSGQYLKRKKINELIGLTPEGKQISKADSVHQALRGNLRPANSKKVFSFETPIAQRLWGYAPSAVVRDQIIRRLATLGIDKANIKTGEEVLHGL
jgi:CRISPR-associated protein Cmr1